MDAWIVKEVYLDRDIGAFSVLAARQAPSIRVHVFEPAPDSYTLLRQNVALNGITNVVTHAFAIGSDSAPLTLYARDGHPERSNTLAPARAATGAR